MATVHKTPSGMYRARAYLGMDEDGNQMRKTFTDPDKNNALSLALAYESVHKEVRVPGSFSLAMDQFLRAKEGTLSPSTITEYYSRRRMLKALFPEFCAKKCVMIDSEDIEELIAYMRVPQAPRHRLHKEPKPFAPKTIQNYMRFISAVLRHQRIPMPVYEAPKKRLPDIYVPTDDEVSRLIEEARGTEMHIPILLAAFGPLRRGEVCALTYPRDFNGDVIHVREAVVKDRHKKLQTKAPKTLHSDRFIQMPDRVISEIAEKGYVTKLKPASISSQFKTVLRHAQLPDFRYHDLRHYCVSTLHAQGVPDAYIMQRGGWTTDTVLKAVYRHTLADQEKRYAQKALNHFDQLF